MDTSPEQLNFILKLIENIGPVGAVIVILSLLFGVAIIQILIWFFKKRLQSQNASEIKKAVDECLASINIHINSLSNDQDKIMDTIRSNFQGIVLINNKLRNTISKIDTIKLIRIITLLMICFSIIEKCMLIHKKLIGITDDSVITAEKEQFILDIKNIWSSYLEELNSFKTIFNLGDYIDAECREKFFKELGYFSVIEDTVFNNSYTVLQKYDRIKATINLMINELIDLVNKNFIKLDIHFN